MTEQILSCLPQDYPWADRLQYYPQLESTNRSLKLLGCQGAPHGTAVIAGFQTGGQGRMGRHFHSPRGMGVYLSILLRPDCPPTELMHLTCAAGAAMARAVEQVCGFRPQVKWINDLVASGRKLGGILTEMSLAGGLVEYAVVGIGINCLQQSKDFSPEVAQIATSLTQITGRNILPQQLAAAMTEQLWQMRQTLFTEKARWMAEYKENCITLGKEIQVIQGDAVRPGTALDMDANGGLWVRYTDGSTQVVSSGEVSVRGMYGYL